MRDIDALLAREFRLADDVIYLNNAAVAPWPQRAINAIAAFSEENLRHGARDYGDWARREMQLRARLARLLNAHSDDIALVKNTSEGLSFVAQGFPWQAGDNVVIPAQEFPSNRVVWQALAPTVQVREVALDVSDPEAALQAACDTNTRVLAVSCVHYGTGLRLDLARLGAFCRGRDIALCVDAIQGLGVIPHDVAAMHIDFLAADGHKWLCAPEGLGVFFCASRWRERLSLHEFGWHMLDKVDFTAPTWRPAATARRFECGSPNMLGAYALDASLSLVEELGLAAIEAEVCARSEQLCTRIAAESKLQLLTRFAPGRYAGIVLFKRVDEAPEKTAERLRAQGVVCIPRLGGVRFSPHHFVTPAQLDRALAIALE